MYFFFNFSRSSASLLICFHMIKKVDNMMKYFSAQTESFFQVFTYVSLLRRSSVLFRFSLMKTVRQFTRSSIFMCFITLTACHHVFNFVNSSVVFMQNRSYEVSKQLSLFNLICSFEAMTCICNLSFTVNIFLNF